MTIPYSGKGSERNQAHVLFHQKMLNVVLYASVFSLPILTLASEHCENEIDCHYKHIYLRYELVA